MFKCNVENVNIYSSKDCVNFVILVSKMVLIGSKCSVSQQLRDITFQEVFLKLLVIYLG